MTKVTVIGNVFADLHFNLPRHYLGRKLTEESINLPFGSKIEGAEYDFTGGGTGGNVAVGLQRGGLKTTLITNISTDPFGEAIFKQLTDEGLTLEVQRSDAHSGISIVLRVGVERTIISAGSGAYEYLNTPLPSEDWLHLGALSSSKAQFIAKFTQHVIKTGQRYSCNPSLGMIEDRPHEFLVFLRNCTVLFLNMEEALRLTRLPKLTSPNEVVKAVNRMGVKVACVTDGARGAYVGCDGKTLFAYASTDNINKVDATGAGDAFCSGFLCAYLNTSIQNDVLISTALRYAMANSGSVITKVGGQAGLLSKKELEQRSISVKLKEI